MKDEDSLQRFIFDQMPVRGEYIKLQHSYRTIINQHNYPPAIRQLVGEALAVAGLLSAIIKFQGRLSVQFRGNGKLKFLLAQCDNDFHLRGLAKWEGDLSYGDLMEAFKEGVLVITLDMGENKNRYQGIVAWQGNSLAESIEGYFQNSEQLATRIWLATDERSAVGFLLQIVPGKKLDGVQIPEENLATQWPYVVQQAEAVTPEELLELEYSDLLRALFPHDDLRLLDKVTISFKCTCSRKSGANAILILGKEEAFDELKSHASIVVTCDFCNKEYLFDRADVNKIFEGSNLPPSKLH